MTRSGSNRMTMKVPQNYTYVQFDHWVGMVDYESYHYALSARWYKKRGLTF